MKLVKTANGHKIRMSQKEWMEYGVKAGWMKQANKLPTNKINGKVMSPLHPTWRAIRKWYMALQDAKQNQNEQGIQVALTNLSNMKNHLNQEWPGWENSLELSKWLSEDLDSSQPQQQTQQPQQTQEPKKMPWAQ